MSGTAGAQALGFAVYNDKNNPSVKIAQNKIVMNQTDSNWCAFYIEDATMLIVSDNIIVSNATPASSYGAIEVREDTGSQGSKKTFTINNNQLLYGGIHFTGTASAPTSGYVSGSIKNNNIMYSEIQVTDSVTSPSLLITVEGNTVKYSNQYGIYFFSSGKGLIHGNIVYDGNISDTAAMGAIKVGGGTGTSVKDNIIANLTATGKFKYGIEFTAQGSHFFSDNVITNMVTDPTLNAWTAAPSSGTYYKGNYMPHPNPGRSSAQGWFYTGSAWVEQAPLGWLSTNTTWNPGNLVGGAYETKAVSLTGAQLGDLVLCGMQLDLQRLHLTGWVSSTDNVTCMLSNPSGGADLNLDSENLYIRVIPR